MNQSSPKTAKNRRFVLNSPSSSPTVPVVAASTVSQANLSISVMSLMRSVSCSFVGMRSTLRVVQDTFEPGATCFSGLKTITPPLLASVAASSMP